MPTYLCHGFRWQRRSIRVYVVVQNLDDVSPEWVITPKSSQSLLESFYNLFDFLPFRVPPPSRSSGRGPSIDSERESYFLNANTTNTNPATGGRGRNGSGTRSPSRSRSRSQSHTQSPNHSRQPSHSQRRQSSPPPLPPLSPGEDQSKDLNGHGGGEDFRAQDWSIIKVLEEYDPLNLDEVSRPYAYVADYAVQIDLSVSIAEEIRRYEERNRADRDPPMTGQASDETGRKKSSKKPGWFEKLRDQLQRGEDIRWYVVVNGDETRDWPGERVETPAPTPAQIQHHAQYQLQQQIFKEGDRERRKREGESAGIVRSDRSSLMKPVQAEKELPALRPKISVGDGGGGQGKPKTSSKGGGFRRLFGRTHRDDKDENSP
ncbi:hypothetical protein B0T22DRAFT_136157 [Podospora appendiculata]|uniref:Developmental regulator n=1 Tax=Podospora appendiculata TaxID=314037 RepID=A0AAE0X7T0_9PEZI|nr:hypothetical protein B0T22DRAFT_136157 [Podospora appendiculata]